MCDCHAVDGCGYDFSSTNFTCEMLHINLHRNVEENKTGTATGYLWCDSRTLGCIVIPLFFPKLISVRLGS